MKVLLLLGVLAATQAQAQGEGSEASLVLVLGPPTLVAVALDVVLLTTLGPEGTAGRGRSISTMAFSFVGMAFSVICLGLGLSSPNTTPTWTGVSGATLGIGLLSFILGVWGVGHPELEPEPPPPSKARPAPLRETPLQLNSSPFGFTS